MFNLLATYELPVKWFYLNTGFNLSKISYITGPELCIKFKLSFGNPQWSISLTKCSITKDTLESTFNNTLFPGSNAPIV